MKETVAASVASPRDTIAIRLLSAAVLLGLLANALFFGQPLGLNVTLFLLALLGAALLAGRSKGIRPLRRNLWLVVPLLLVAVSIALRVQPFLTFLNLVAAMGLLLLLAHYFTAGSPFTLTLPGYPLVAARVALHSLGDTVTLLPHVDLRRLRLRGDLARSVLRGLLLAVPILLFFTGLLAAADLIFAQAVSRFFHLAWLEQIAESLWRLAFIFAVAWISAGGLAFALLRGALPAPGGWLGERVRDIVHLGIVEAAIVLLLVDLLFLAFVWIQAFYLFGGQAHLALAEGVTYASYARRGYFELLAVALVALALLLLLVWLTPRASRRARWLFNGAGSLLLALVGVMLASAFYRILLYESAYGLTRLRLYVHVSLVWLALLLAWTLLTLWLPGGEPHTTHRFATGAFFAALGFLLSLNLLNPDALIARYNLGHYLAGGQFQPEAGAAELRATPGIDAAYLTWLGDDAVPVLVDAVTLVEGQERESICTTLRWRQMRYAQGDPWFAFNLGRLRARNALRQEGWQELCPPLEDVRAPDYEPGSVSPGP